MQQSGPAMVVVVARKDSKAKGIVLLANFTQEFDNSLLYSYESSLAGSWIMCMC
jgi:hypothetical protein